MSLVLAPGQSVRLAGADTEGLTLLDGSALYSDSDGDGVLVAGELTTVAPHGDVLVSGITNARVYVTPSRESIENEAAQLVYPSDEIETIVGENPEPKTKTVGKAKVEKPAKTTGALAAKKAKK